ncbi:DNA polymerase III subunit epsilon [Roseospira visakhapatnamensis]|uniref:DNA polymerase III subunit epsilon n=1 Tax=Roseospira visakhapatnamensis TaxID=390880 RepID=UPI00160A3357
MREIVLDTETTGFDPDQGDRIVEIGALELLNHVATGRTYHVYLNPERDMPEGAYRVHGLSSAFLADKPLFHEVVDAFLTFIADSALVIHNAAFDMKFLNAELARIDRPPLSMDRAIDTVTMARRKFPGAPASLDALCRRFAIDNAHRALHGALLDSELLAEVYLELMGGREPGLGLMKTGAARRGADPDDPGGADGALPSAATRPRRSPRPHQESAAERDAHGVFLTRLKDPIWLR